MISTEQEQLLINFLLRLLSSVDRNKYVKLCNMQRKLKISEILLDLNVGTELGKKAPVPPPNTFQYTTLWDIIKNSPASFAKHKIIINIQHQHVDINIQLLNNDKKLKKEEIKDVMNVKKKKTIKFDEENNINNRRITRQMKPNIEKMHQNNLYTQQSIDVSVNEILEDNTDISAMVFSTKTIDTSVLDISVNTSDKTSIAPVINKSVVNSTVVASIINTDDSNINNVTDILDVEELYTIIPDDLSLLME